MERASVVIDADVVDAQFELAALVGLPVEGRPDQEGSAGGGPENAADQCGMVVRAREHADPGVFVAGAIGPDGRRCLDETDLAGGPHLEPLSLRQGQSGAGPCDGAGYVDHRR